MRLRALALAATLLAVHSSAAAQEPGFDPRRVYLARGELESLMEFYELSAQSPAYSERLRDRARAEGSLVRARLDNGDYQVGDRIVLAVANETALSDTFTVAQGRLLELGELADLPLTGVLRSELEDRVRAHLRQYLRDPSVRALSLIRVSVEGGVARPGFYVIPSQTPLADVVMAAGGPASDGQIQDLIVQRGELALVSTDEVRAALADGTTLDQLNLRAGDRIVVPRRGTSQSVERLFRIVSLALALPLSIVGLLSIF